MHRTVERMLRTHPEPAFAPPDALAQVIHACLECSQACTANADAGFGDHIPGGYLDACIRLSLDCADVCHMTSRILSRQQAPDLALIALVLELCVAACETTAREAERHAGKLAHCQVAAMTCRRCIDAARTLMLGPHVDQVH